MTLSYGNRVFIGGISSTVSKDDIGNEFGKFGKLRSIWLASKPPGFAFIEYEDTRDAEEAVKSLNGVSLFNENKIRVEISKKRPAPGPGPAGMAPDRGSRMFRSNGPPPRPNPNFRTGNTFPFKPSRFPPRDERDAPRYNSRLSDSPPRYHDEFSSRPPPPRSSDSSRFSSRPRPMGEPRFAPSSGGRSQGFSRSGGYRDDGYRGHPMD